VSNARFAADHPEKPPCGKFRIANRVLDIAVAEISLQGSRIMPCSN